MLHKFTIIVVLLLTVVARPSATVLLSLYSLSLPQLYDTASVVVRGRLDAIRDSGASVVYINGRPTEARSFIASVVLDRVYKGHVTESTIDVEFSRPGGGICATSLCQTFTIGEHDLLFLTRGGSAKYALIDHEYAKIDVSPLLAPTSKAGIGGIVLDLLPGLADNNDDLKVNNIILIGASGETQSSAELIRAFRFSSQSVRLAIHAALLRLHDWTLLTQLPGDFPSGRPIDLRTARIEESILTSVSEIKDPLAMPALMGLAEAYQSPLKKAAVHALRRCQSSQCVPALIRVLSDPDREIRYDAVMALSTIEREPEFGPSFDLFEREEAKYIAHWMTWWESRPNEPPSTSNVPRP